MEERDGFMRPSFVGEAKGDEASEARTFDRVCPGRTLRAPTTEAYSHPTFGRYESVWRAFATDETVRFEGSSAGVLSALSAYALESGHAEAVAASGVSSARPLKTIPIRAITREEVIQAAGSRYAPVAALDGRITASTVVVGKPCEISALRALRAAEEPDVDHPVVLSFFCAGVPRQGATEKLVAGFGVDSGSVRELRYRGRGWPGSFRVVTDTATHEMSYEESWGAHLGKDLQWRCKICPDGTGADADVAVGDYWDSDEHGFPVFVDQKGVSVAIARTRKGHEFLMRAAAAGIVELEPLDIDSVASVQPLQVKRKQVLFGRLLGRRLAGRAVPAYFGYSMLRMALRWPRENLAAARGAFERSLPAAIRRFGKRMIRMTRKPS